MKKSKKLLIGSLISAALIIAVTFGLTYAYLTDHEVKDNIITIGNVDLEIVETDFDTSTSTEHYLVAQQIQPKSPQIKNIGSTNEYVFMSVKVPLRRVTLLYEKSTEVEGTGHSEGTPVVGISGGNPASFEVFKMQVSGSTPQHTDIEKNHSNCSQTDFSYYHGTDPSADDDNVYKEGWVLLNEYPGITDDGYHEFVFGYNKRLSPNEETHQLFDQVQLKSFIDQELARASDYTTQILINAYGIQTRNLNGITGEPEELNGTQLNTIFGIIKNKNSQS